jgi:hypothetical protein
MDEQQYNHIYQFIIEGLGNVSDECLIVLLDLSTAIKKAAGRQYTPQRRQLRQEVINELFMRDSDVVNDHLDLITTLACLE